MPCSLIVTGRGTLYCISVSAPRGGRAQGDVYNIHLVWDSQLARVITLETIHIAHLDRVEGMPNDKLRPPVHLLSSAPCVSVTWTAYPEQIPAAKPIKGECGFASTALPFPLSLAEEEAGAMSGFTTASPAISVEYSSSSMCYQQVRRVVRMINRPVDRACNTPAPNFSILVPDRVMFIRRGCRCGKCVERGGGQSSRAAMSRRQCMGGTSM